MKLKRKKEEKVSIRQQIAESFEASKEMILDVPRLVFIGNGEVAVENYRSIGEYTRTTVVLEAKRYSLRFTGKDLELKSITREMLLIIGDIKGLEFVKEG